MKKLFITLFLLFNIVSFLFCDEITKSKVNNGYFKYDKNISIEWVYYEDYDEILVYSYMLQPEEYDKENKEVIDLESAAINFTNFYKSFYSRNKIYSSIKRKTFKVKYNVVFPNNNTYILVESRFNLKL